MWNKEEFTKKARELTGMAKDFAIEQKDKALDFLEEKQFQITVATKIAKETEELKELYCTYGKLAYLEKVGGDRPTYEANMANKLIKDITEKEEMIESLEAELEDYNKAHEMPTEEAETEESCTETEKLDFVFCIKCGHKNVNEAQFCIRCGNKIHHE